MTAPNTAVYAGSPLGPSKIDQNLAATQGAGWTTIILGLYHIGRPSVTGQHWGDIIFNDTPVIQQGQVVTPSGWPARIAQLKQGTTSITKIYASVGGGSPVVDFQSIETIYQNNGNSFSGTDLEKDFQVFRQTFPAIDGIDMDCEDRYDQPSFVAFCEMLIGMGFEITFCPYSLTNFWPDSLAAIEKQHAGAVKWWNLQCYDGGYGNDPKGWADAITSAIPGFDTEGFIVAGDWTNDTPSGVTTLLKPLAGESCTGGGFIWNMDGILAGQNNMKDYVNAIGAAFSGS